MKSPLPYIGSKSKLAQIITDMIPKHVTYCEPFCGAAWVFFTKEPTKYEVINDLDSELVAFYRVLQHHLEEFVKQFKWLLTSRELFEDWKRQQEAGGLTDIQKAARYYYLQKTCFSGRVKNRSFGVSVDRFPRINLMRMEEELSEVHLRMSKVTVENLTYQSFIPRYDRNGTFFYIDPPYYKKPYYKHNLLELSDFEEMAAILKKCKGQFILSINDVPEIRKVFNKFKVKPVKLTYTAPSGKGTVGKELLVLNF